MEHPIRIALLSEHASPLALLGGQDAGGQNVYVDEVSRHVGHLGYAVDVFTRRDSPDAPEVIEWTPNVRVVHLAAGPPAPIPKDDLWPFMPAFYDALLSFMLRTGVRYDLTHGNFWMSGWVAARLKRRLGIPAVQIFHATGKTKRRHQGDADTSPGERIAVEAAIIEQVDRVIVQCPSEQLELVEDYQADPAKIALIPGAVNLDRFHPVPRDEARRRIGLATAGPVVVYVGRLLPRKDIRNIVRAVALLVRMSDTGSQGHPPPDPRSSIAGIQLLIVGGESATPDPIATPEIGVLQALAAELGIADRVHFTGSRCPDVLHDYYSAGDVMVTTPWYEPFGLTPLESMACGRPVIGSAVGGIPFTVQDGVTGFLIPPRDPAALAGRLQYLLSRPDLCAQMGQAARARMERHFAWQTTAQRTAELYLSVLGVKRSVIGGQRPRSNAGLRLSASRAGRSSGRR